MHDIEFYLLHTEYHEAEHPPQKKNRSLNKTQFDHPHCTQTAQNIAKILQIT